MLEPWRWQASAFASLASPEQSRRLRVGLPTRVKLQKTSQGVLLTCSFPTKVSNHLRAVSHYLNNRISKLASQTQGACSLDQLQNGLVQYQHSGSNPEPPAANALGQYQPAGNKETPLARDDLNSDVIVNAQLTHLNSRDDATQGQDAPHVSDVLMPDVPAVHDIATPRRTVGGRCRKWCISAQPASGKRKCAAYTLCGIRFTHGEARLQQWGNRETNHHYVHAHCVNGGLGHDHELFPKQATDQDAVDAVIRQRDTMTRTAADTEVLLPFAQDPVRAECDCCSGAKHYTQNRQAANAVTYSQSCYIGAYW